MFLSPSHLFPAAELLHWLTVTHPFPAKHVSVSKPSLLNCCIAVLTDSDTPLPLQTVFCLQAISSQPSAELQHWLTVTSPSPPVLFLSSLGFSSSSCVSETTVSTTCTWILSTMQVITVQSSPPSVHNEMLTLTGRCLHCSCMRFDAKEDCIVSFHPQKDNIFKTDPPKCMGLVLTKTLMVFSRMCFLISSVHWWEMLKGETISVAPDGMGSPFCETKIHSLYHTRPLVHHCNNTGMPVHAHTHTHTHTHTLSLTRHRWTHTLSLSLSYTSQMHTHTHTHTHTLSLSLSPSLTHTHTHTYTQKNTQKTWAWNQLTC